MFFGSSKKDQWVKRFSSQSTSVPSCIFSGIISIFCQSTLYRFNACPAAQRRAAWAEQCRQQRQSCNGLISPKATQIFSKAVQFFWKVNHDTWEKFISLRDSLFHSGNKPSTKRFHRKMLKTCMSFLLEFVYCAFFPFLYTNGTPSRYVVHYV